MEQTRGRGQVGGELWKGAEVQQEGSFTWAREGSVRDLECQVLHLSVTEASRELSTDQAEFIGKSSCSPGRADSVLERQLAHCTGRVRFPALAGAPSLSSSLPSTLY